MNFNFKNILILLTGTFFLVHGIPIPQRHCQEDKLDESGGMELSNKKKQGKVEFSNMIIDIKFWVIHDGKNGYLKQNQISDQVTVLNEAYGGKQSKLGVDSKMRFRIKEIKYIENSEWYYGCSKNENAIISENKGSSDKYVSIYTCHDSSYLGFAYYPWSWGEGHSRQVIFSSPHTFPGGKLSSYNMGLTVVHEMGHFLGLRHTFSRSSSCTWGDDGIADTPHEKTPSYGCDLKRDTCPDKEGKDPVWSYMDYSIDSCLDRFSPDQTTYMVNAVSKYRPKLKQLSIQNYDELYAPTPSPTFKPTSPPTYNPTNLPTKNPTFNPTNYPTFFPSLNPTNYPTLYPTYIPTQSPSLHPTFKPSQYPTYFPSVSPTKNPTNIPTQAPTSLYEYCDIRKKDGIPHKWMCTNGKYNQKCTWHWHYIKCMPLAHEDPIDIFCDVRKNSDQSKTSRWKCMRDFMQEKCYWDSEQEKCFPRTQEPTANPTFPPTFNPTSKPTFQPTFQPTSQPSSQPSLRPTKFGKGMGMGMGKAKKPKP
jgi:hypothetical protein